MKIFPPNFVSSRTAEKTLGFQRAVLFLKSFGMVNGKNRTRVMKGFRDWKIKGAILKMDFQRRLEVNISILKNHFMYEKHISTI